MTNYYRSIPNDLKTNNYLLELQLGLHDRGWVNLDFPFWNFISIFKYRQRCNIIHMHFPEAFWRGYCFSFSIFMAGYFLFLMITSKIVGYKLVFSLHNVLPHKFTFYRLEVVMRKLLYRLSDHIIVFSNAEIKQIRKYLNLEVSHNKLDVIEHGLYTPMSFLKKDIIYYNNLHKLDSRDKRIKILTFDSKNRANKNAKGFLNAWRGLDSESKMNVEVIVISDYSDIDNNDVSVRFIQGPVKNIDFFIYISDYILLNYSDITTSGMFYHAKTYLKPVIMPNLDFFEEVKWENDIVFDRKLDMGEALVKIIIPQLGRQGKSNNITSEGVTIMETSKLVAGVFNRLIRVE